RQSRRGKHQRKRRKLRLRLRKRRRKRKLKNKGGTPMAIDRQTLIDRLMRRFKGVPNFNEEDAEAIVDEAIEAHDDQASANLILLYAQSQAAWQVAISVAHYFRF